MRTCNSALFLFSAVVMTVVSLSLFLSVPVQAKGTADGDDSSAVEERSQGQKDDIPLLTEESKAGMDAAQARASEHLITAATWFDSFFNDDRYATEINKTTARLILSAGVDRHEDFEFKPRLRLRLHLPRAGDRLNLVISAHDDEDFDVEQDPGNVNYRDDDANVTAALSYFLLQTEKMNISTSAGISFDYVYGGLRYRTAHDYGSWQGRFISRLRYYSDDGWEFKNKYDIERQVSDRFLFRTTLEADWLEEENGVPHGLIFSLFQALGPDRALYYDIGNYFDTRPSYQMTDTVLRLRYRQRFYRDWLVLEVGPQVSFPEEYDREFNPGIIFKLEAEFGYKSYEDQFKRVFSF